LDPLGKLKKLTHLTVIENPVAREEHYRSWVIWRCPNVRYLDFQKVKDAERERAEELFGDDDEMTPLAKNIISKKAVAVGGADDDTNGVQGRVKLTSKERKKVEQMIRNAKSLAEIERLEKELTEGRIPIGAGGDDSDEEMDG
jgi:U2 small nuclear ribonucleoprotein A'